MGTFSDLVKPLQYFLFGVAFLLILYLFLMTLATKDLNVALSQLNFYKFWIITLAIGFGIQLGLYKFMRIKNINTRVSSKVTKTTGTTSTLTMVACCAHHLTDILPIIGLSAAASFLGLYTREMFTVGIIFNFLGIVYLIRLLKGKHDGKC